MDKLLVTESKFNNVSGNGVSADNRCSLTSEFWQEFAESVWEKNTFAKREGFVRPPISEEELFKCVVDMSIDHCEVRDAGGEITDVRVYVKGVEVNKDYDHLFPKLTDKNFAGYSGRVSKLLGGQPFAFVIDEIVMPTSLKAWTLSFLKGMYRPLRSISNGHMWSIFFGDYSTTPYGVHDHSTQIFSESAFYFPIVGQKEMTTWRPSYVNDNPALRWAHNYSDHVHASTRLLAEPGGMMYWPSDRWHIGSSGGGDVSIVLAVRAFSDIYPMFLHSIMNLEALFPYKPWGIRAVLCHLSEGLLFLKHMVLLRYSVRARQNQVREFPFDPDDLQGSAREIPEELKKIGRRLNIRFYFGKNLEKVLSIFWLYHLANLGVESRNSPLPPISLKPELQIRRSPGVVLLWRQIDEETIILVADRFAYEIPVLYLPTIKLIAAKQVGQEVFYQDLLDSVSTQNIPAQNLKMQLGKLLEFLGESGAFTDNCGN